MDSYSFTEQYKKRRQWEKDHKFLTFFKDAYNYVIYGIPNRLGDLKRKIKWGFQRMFRGYDDTAIWNLDSYVTEIALPVLKWYKKYGHGLPWNEEVEPQRSFTTEEWNDVLDKMILSFQLIHDEDEDFQSHDTEWYTEHNNQIQEGLNLFAKYYRNLWD